MPYINVDEAYILNNTGLQVDQVVDIPYTDAALTDGQKEQARKNIGAGGTNPNLIDNPWFTVRQRGNGPFNANGLTVDRWQIGGGPPTVTPQAPYGVSISATAGYTLFQNLPYTVAEYGGKTMTLSAIVDGELYAVTFVYTAGQIPYVTFNGNNDLIRYDCTNAQVRITHNIAATTHNFTVTAVKLELGSVSTLANDTPPDYGTELLKCMRYFIRLTGYNNENFGFGYAIAGTIGVIHLPIPVPMRTTPTVSTNGSFNLIGAGAAKTVTAIGTPTNGINGIQVQATSSSLTTNQSYMLVSTANGTYIDLSADL